MKATINNLIFLSITIFVAKSINIEAKPICTKPWVNIVDTVTVDGCDYEIDLCVYCAFAYPGKVKINYYRNISGCTPTIPPNQITNQIISQISTYAYFWFDYCQFNLPPCSGSLRKKIEWDIYICWKAKLVIKGATPHDDVYLHLPCEDNDTFCRVTYSYCVDEFAVVHHNVSGYLGYNFDPSCTLEGSAVFPLPPSAMVGDETACYVLHTVCNP
ncbi:MAG: hypothetical protein WC121_00530 [Candidatus Kapaibacterium sp.]